VVKKQKKLKTECRSERSDASPGSTKVSLMRTALNLCNKTEMRCQRKDVSRRSPVTAVD